MDFSTVITNIFFGLFKASLLFVFIYAIVEVFKNVSVVGLFKVFWQIGWSLLSNNKRNGQPRKVDPEAWHTLVFIIALVACKLLNFTLIATFLGLDLGDTTKFGKGATWFDYVATSAVIYKGTDWFYKTFGDILSKGFEFKKLLEGLIGRTITTEKTEKTSRVESSEVHQ
jgi:hypothetical protein